MSKRKSNDIAENQALPADLVERLSRTDRYAVEQLADFEGPSIFNPLIGRSPTDTFNRLQDALGAMSAILREGGDIDSTQLCRGLEVMTDCMWAAAQYEAFRVNRN